MTLLFISAKNIEQGRRDKMTLGSREQNGGELTMSGRVRWRCGINAVYEKKVDLITLFVLRNGLVISIYSVYLQRKKN